MGARPLRRAIQRYIEDPLADFVLGRALEPGLDDPRRPQGPRSEVDIAVIPAEIAPREGHRPARGADATRRDDSRRARVRRNTRARCHRGSATRPIGAALAGAHGDAPSRRRIRLSRGARRLGRQPPRRLPLCARRCRCSRALLRGSRDDGARAAPVGSAPSPRWPASSSPSTWSPGTRAIEQVGAGLATVLGNLQVVLVGLIAWLILARAAIEPLAGRDPGRAVRRRC